MNGALLVYQISAKIVNSLNLVKNTYINHYIVPNKYNKRIFKYAFKPRKRVIKYAFHPYFSCRLKITTENVSFGNRNLSKKTYRNLPIYLIPLIK